MIILEFIIKNSVYIFIPLFLIILLLLLLSKLKRFSENIVKKYAIKLFFILMVLMLLDWIMINYFVSKVRDDFKKDLVDCIIYIDNKKINEKEAKDLLQEIKQLRFRINGRDKYFSSGYGFYVRLMCSNKEIPLIIAQSNRKSNVYILYTRKYSKYKYVELGKIKSEVLPVYKPERLLKIHFYR